MLNNDNRTVLMYAAVSENSDTGVYVNTKNKTITELLIKKGADIDAIDIYGCTFLDYACKSGSLRNIPILVIEGAKLKEEYNNSNKLIKKC